MYFSLLNIFYFWCLFTKYLIFMHLKPTAKYENNTATSNYLVFFPFLLNPKVHGFIIFSKICTYFIFFCTYICYKTIFCSIIFFYCFCLMYLEGPWFLGQSHFWQAEVVLKSTKSIFLSDKYIPFYVTLLGSGAELPKD